MWHILHISDLNRVNSVARSQFCRKNVKEQEPRAQQHQTAVTSTPTTTTTTTTCRLYIYLSKINYTLTHSIRRKSSERRKKKQMKFAHDTEWVTTNGWQKRDGLKTANDNTTQCNVCVCVFFMIFVEPWNKSGCSWNLTQKTVMFVCRPSFTHSHNWKQQAPKKQLIVSFTKVVVVVALLLKIPCIVRTSIHWSFSTSS